MERHRHVLHTVAVATRATKKPRAKKAQERQSAPHWANISAGSRTFALEGLKEVREELGWTQENLAEAAEVSTTTIGRLEVGLSGFSSQMLRNLCAVTGKPLYRLLGYQAPPDASLTDDQRKLIRKIVALEDGVVSMLLAAAERAEVDGRLRKEPPELTNAKAGRTA